MKKIWIARDKDGTLHLFYSKPRRYENFFGGSHYFHVALMVEEFPEVTWENSPKRVTLKLEENETASIY